MEELKGHLVHAVKQFFSTGYIDLYKIIFGTPPFPFWFIVHCVWSCYVVRLSGTVKQNKKPVMRFIWHFCTAFGMVFATKEFLAFFMKRPSPIKARPISLAVFAVIFLFIEYCPGNLGVNLVSSLSYFLGLLEGMYQMKLFTLCLRNIRIVKGGFCLAFSLFLALLDQMIESMFRTAAGGLGKHASGLGYSLRTLMIFVSYWLITHENNWTPFIGIKPIIPMALVFTFVQGLMNAFSLIISKPSQKSKIEKAKKHKSKTKTTEEPSPEPTKTTEEPSPEPTDPSHPKTE